MTAPDSRPRPAPNESLPAFAARMYDSLGIGDLYDDDSWRDRATSEGLPSSSAFPDRSDRLDPDPLRPPEMDPARVNPYRPVLPRFREQRRRSRLGCSVSLVALTLACLVFWAAVLFVAVNVFAAPRNAPVQLAQSGAPQNVRADGSGENKAGAAGTLATDRETAINRTHRHGVASPATESGAPLPPVYTGKLGYALPSHGSRYLAIRWPRGTVATLCGPADCVTRTSTDFGPVRSLWEAGRLADLSAVDWQRVCGVPLRFGLCSGTLLIVSRPRALPETDTQ